jgi:hypothetical protein
MMQPRRTGLCVEVGARSERRAFWELYCLELRQCGQSSRRTVIEPSSPALIAIWRAGQESLAHDFDAGLLVVVLRAHAL